MRHLGRLCSAAPRPSAGRGERWLRLSRIGVDAKLLRLVAGGDGIGDGSPVGAGGLPVPLGRMLAWLAFSFRALELCSCLVCAGALA